MKNYAYYVVSLLALAFAALGSCQKEDGASLLEEQKRYKFTLSEAKKYFYSEATDLQLPSQTVGKVKSGLPALNDITTIDWKSAEVKDYTNYLSYEIPLHNSRHTHGVMLQKIGADSVLSEYADVHYSLLLQRAKSKDTTRMLVSTIISLAKERKRVEKLHSNRFHGNRRGFTGYVIVSTLDGVIESIYRYDKGNREHHCGYNDNSFIGGMSNNSHCFYLLSTVDNQPSTYTYSESGMCLKCGQMRLLNYPEMLCDNCVINKDMCNICWEDPCVCDTRQCQCVGGCSCRCTGTCTNCNGKFNSFECPKCGKEECDGNCDNNDKPEQSDGTCEKCGKSPCVCQSSSPSPRCQCAGDCDCNCTNGCTDCNGNQVPVDPPTGEVCENCGLNPCECS